MVANGGVKLVMLLINVLVSVFDDGLVTGTVVFERSNDFEDVELGTIVVDFMPSVTKV